MGEGRTTFTNNGSIYANTNGGTLTLQPGGGTADFTNASSGGLFAYNGGTLAFSNASGGTLTNNGLISVDSGSTVTVPAGALTNFSGTTLTGGAYAVTAFGTSSPATLSVGGGSVVTNNASVQLSGPGAVFNEINALATNASGGSFQLNAGRNFTTAGALTNAGTVAVAASTLTVSGSLNNSGLTATSGGGTITVQGSLTNSGQLATGMAPGTGNSISATGALTQTSAGTIYGNGSLTAPTLSLAGTLRPGDADYFGYVSPAVCTLTLNGAATLLGNTALVFDLASTAASDQIKVNGTLTLDGTLTVNALAGFSAGRYDLINYTGGLTNNTLDLGTLPGGYNYAIDTSIAGQVDLVVTNIVPEPSTWAAVFVGVGCLAFALRRRAMSQP